MQNPTAIIAPESGQAEDGGKSGPKPRVPYWHLGTDESGVSHQKQCALTQFELKGVGGADPQWNNKLEKVPSTVVITVQPVGWIGDWHENPAPQWIIVLSGHWWIESMDGTRIEQGAWRVLVRRGPKLQGERG